MADKRRELDWASTEVHDGTVVVALTGKASKAWSESFAGVLRLLGHGTGDWGEISLEKNALRVERLQPKAERDLRHYLEAVVVQVNSELAEPVSETQPEPADPQELEDEQMAATLRSFGEPQGEDPDAA